MFSLLKNRGAIVVAGHPRFFKPISQLVTVSQFYEKCYRDLAARLSFEVVLDRKIWEYCFIVNAIETYASTGPNTKGLVFGCGKESLASFFASTGSNIVATDYVDQEHDWQAKGLNDLYCSRYLDRDIFEQLVEFRHVDMNSIDTTLRDFDFIWSTGSLEHIGGHAKGLNFIEEAMKCLKPGGIAVHTTEFTLSSKTVGHDDPNLSFYCQKDVELLADRLINSGHMMLICFERGDTVADNFVDVPPFHYGRTICAHLLSHVITSIGLIIQKGNS